MIQKITLLSKLLLPILFPYKILEKQSLKYSNEIIDLKYIRVY